MNEQDIRITFGFLHGNIGDSVFEVSGIGTEQRSKQVEAGYFNDREKATKAAMKLTTRYNAVYVTLNPVNPALLARAQNRTKLIDKRTGDADILHLNRLLIDIDPERPSGVSSSDAEHEAALLLANTIRSDLEAAGWSEPLVGDSGNGGHLVYPIDLENTPENVDLLKRVLKGLQRRYAEEDGRISVDGIKLSVDQTVFNPGRISKVYGTWARKGDNTQERPHRIARILSIPLPAAFKTVPRELLEAVAIVKESSSNNQKDGQQETKREGSFDVRAYLTHYGVDVLGEKPHNGSTLYLLRECLFDSSYRDGESAIGQTAEGKLFYHCYHNSCREQRWHDARQKISGSDRIGQFVHGAKVGGSNGARPTGGESKRGAHSDPLSKLVQEMDEAQKLQFAREAFPRVDYPWDVFPPALTGSLQTLARSCATSPVSIPGAAFCILASVFGRVVGVSPKSEWIEPLTIWHGDIRQSGDGKTPPARMLSRVIKDLQKKEHQRYEAENRLYQQQLKADRKNADLSPPVKPRGYFATDLTLEGLRYELMDHPTGGLFVIQDELSGFINAQNQYKTRGNDRESWLTLWDGHAARVVRKEGSTYLNGARVSIFGGIQPGVFAKVFQKEEGLYIQDGTLFRFLLTFEPTRHYPLDETVWSPEQRAVWEEILHQAMHWTERILREQQGQIEEPRLFIFEAEAQAAFFAWRNTLDQYKEFLPIPMRGFIPKAVSYAIRLSGLIHCLHAFAQRSSPSLFITVPVVGKAIQIVGFLPGANR